MIEKMIGAFTFKPGVYSEAKKDAGFSNGETKCFNVVDINNIFSLYCMF